MKKNHLKIIVLFSIYILVVSSSLHAQCLWRGAKTLPKGSFIIISSYNYIENVKSYNWDIEKWEKFADRNKIIFHNIQTMIGYALTDRIETMLHVPISFKSNYNGDIREDNKGIGDILIKTRFAPIPWNKRFGGITLVGTFRFATGDYNKSLQLGDGTFDYAFGGMFSSSWQSNWRHHLKMNYWFNGKDHKDIDIGDELKIITKIDRRLFSRFIGFINYTYHKQFDKIAASGEKIENSSKYRHYIIGGLIFNPLKKLNVRPKVMLPISAKGGSLFAIKLSIDLWYSFALSNS